MSSMSIAALGAIAGFTILLGLPVARIRQPSAGVTVLLNGTAIGILIFLLWDVLSHAVEPLEGALVAASIEGTGGWGDFAALAVVTAAGLVAGLMGLVYYDRWMRTRRRPARAFGPGAANVEELAPPRLAAIRTPGGHLALLIAVGIGLHNFAEGLAIGQSAAAGEISLALMLIIGFGLHNATEGFGIVAPMSGESERPSWRFLVLLGVIGGGPTFVGTLIGQSVVNDLLSVGFLTLAAGSILYVVIQLLRVLDRLGRKELASWGLLLGFALGLATDFVLVAAGG